MTGTSLSEGPAGSAHPYETDAQLGLLAMCTNKRALYVAPKSWGSRAPEGLRVEVPCRRCWQCRTSRVWDWVGKCIAEAKTAKSVSFVTLTYGQGKWVRDPKLPEHAKALHYEDVQKWLKRIRIAGYPVRYVVAGEYGERKGRAHWHAILFWQDREPNHTIGNEFNDKFWPHGHVNWQEFSVERAKYVCKYLLKYDHAEGNSTDETLPMDGIRERAVLAAGGGVSVDKPKERRMTEFHFSARPGIGFEWLRQRAQLHVDQGLAPRDPWYYFPEVKNSRGELRQFYLSPAAQVNLVRLFHELWKEQRTGHPPSTAFTEKMNDVMATPMVLDAMNKRGYAAFPDFLPYEGAKVYVDELRNAYYCEPFGQQVFRVYWSFNERGERSWERDLRTAQEARAIRADYVTRNSSEMHREASQASGWRRAAG